MFHSEYTFTKYNSVCADWDFEKNHKSNIAVKRMVSPDCSNIHPNTNIGSERLVHNIEIQLVWKFLRRLNHVGQLKA